MFIFDIYDVVLVVSLLTLVGLGMSLSLMEKFKRWRKNRARQKLRVKR